MMSPGAVARSTARRWSMTSDALDSLRTNAERLAEEVDRTGSHVSARLTGEPDDAPALVPNVDAPHLVRMLQGVRSALALARVETDARLAVIGRRITLEAPDESRKSYALVIPGHGDPAKGWVSADSPVGQAIYGRGAGDEVRVDAPSGAWRATVVLSNDWLPSRRHRRQ